MQLEYWGQVFDYEVADSDGVVLCERTQQPKQYYKTGWYICTAPEGKFAVRPADLIVNGRLL